MGPIMLDVAGTSLSAEDKELLAHPLVGGLILFSRNYENPEQIAALNEDIRMSSAKQPGKEILIAVDHEGGRVQRFREHFSALPAMGNLWDMAGQSEAKAIELANYAGQLMAMEVMSVGIDISFAPVVDVDGISDVIGDRAFSSDPKRVEALARGFVRGMHSVGMKCTAKHFPGHGSVKEDSHFGLPVDKRLKAEILGFDMEPFRQLMTGGFVNAVMPAHVIYPEIDDKSVGFSTFWLQEVLRGQLGFNGVIFSDDLSMEGAASIGGFVERSEAAQQAGCDMLLVCNNRDAAIDVIDNANIGVIDTSTQRIKSMLSTTQFRYEQLPQLAEWQTAKQALGIG